MLKRCRHNKSLLFHQGLDTVVHSKLLVLKSPTHCFSWAMCEAIYIKIGGCLLYVYIKNITFKKYTYPCENVGKVIL